jgi:cytochrome P450
MDTTAAVDLSYDPFDPGVHHDPYPGSVFAWMREHRPVYRNEMHDFWAVSRFADVQALAREWKSFSNAGARGVDLDATGSHVYGEGNFLEQDPPRHGALRGLIKAAYSPRAIGNLKPLLTRDARILIDALPRSGADVAGELCWPLAFTTTAGMLGIPDVDLPYVQALLKQALLRAPSTPEIPASAMDGARRLRECLGTLIAAPRGLPPGLLLDLAHGCADGQLSTAEAVGIALLVLGAGVETPSAAVANMLLLLARHPEQRDRVRRGDVELEAAIEELLRFESPVQYLARTAATEVDLHGTLIPAGGTILLLFGAANRDATRWLAADSLDLSRLRQRNLAFGEGIHHCLGAGLTRLEARVILELFLVTAPDYEVAGPITRTINNTDWGVLGLPVAW